MKLSASGPAKLIGPSLRPPCGGDCLADAVRVAPGADIEQAAPHSPRVHEKRVEPDDRLAKNGTGTWGIVLMRPGALPGFPGMSSGVLDRPRRCA